MSICTVSCTSYRRLFSTKTVACPRTADGTTNNRDDVTVLTLWRVVWIRHKRWKNHVLVPTNCEAKSTTIRKKETHLHGMAEIEQTVTAWNHQGSLSRNKEYFQKNVPGNHLRRGRYRSLLEPFSPSNLSIRRHCKYSQFARTYMTVCHGEAQSKRARKMFQVDLRSVPMTCGMIPTR
jgi:hypothetical protein